MSQLKELSLSFYGFDVKPKIIGVSLMNRIALFGLLAIIAAGCAQTSGYRPTYDAYGDPNPHYLGYDDQECQQIASNAVHTGRDTLRDGLVGGAIGAAGGAAIGAVVGNPGAGAALGAAAGGIAGGAKGGIESDERFKRIYRNCMRNRGHRPLD